MDKGLPAGTLPQRDAGTRVMVWPFCWRPSFGTPTGIPRTRGLGKCSSDEVSLLGSEQAQEDWGMDWELRVGLKGEKPTQQVTDYCFLVTSLGSSFMPISLHVFVHA